MALSIASTLATIVLSPLTFLKTMMGFGEESKGSKPESETTPVAVKTDAVKKEATAVQPVIKAAEPSVVEPVSKTHADTVTAQKANNGAALSK